jgi:lipid II:glycine glycyltransferase (peptidoglycan interpeptide bridge formation enzyme)
MIKSVGSEFRKDFDRLAVHPLQSWSWGEFREKLGQKVIRLGRFSNGKLVEVAQTSIHRIPHLSYTIGYCPRGPLPTKEMVEAVREEVKKYNCIFVKFEPGILKGPTLPRQGRTLSDLRSLGLKQGKALFTPFTFQIDLTKSEEELLAGMKPKTRYNIRLAEKKGVIVEEDNSDEAFAQFQRLTEETTRRQHFYAHDRKYRQLMWETMREAGIARLLIAKNKKQKTKNNVSVLTAWIIFIFNGVGYYPYGASSEENRELMASNLAAWRALQLAKAAGCKKFDFWGSLGPEPDTTDSWYGFHRFKEGYDGELVEFVGSWDLVTSPLFYSVYKIGDWIRWRILRLKT